MQFITVYARPFHTLHGLRHSACPSPGSPQSDARTLSARAPGQSGGTLIAGEASRPRLIFGVGFIVRGLRNLQFQPHLVPLIFIFTQ